MRAGMAKIGTVHRQPNSRATYPAAIGTKAPPICWKAVNMPFDKPHCQYGNQFFIVPVVHGNNPACAIPMLHRSSKNTGNWTAKKHNPVAAEQTMAKTDS